MMKALPFGMPKFMVGGVGYVVAVVISMSIARIIY
jgi:hypothetical protein